MSTWKSITDSQNRMCVGTPCRRIGRILDWCIWLGRRAVGFRIIGLAKAFLIQLYTMKAEAEPGFCVGW